MHVADGEKLIPHLFVEIPITSSDFWQNEDECTEEVLRHVFRSATEEEIPMFQERMACLREAGNILYEVRNLSRPSIAPRSLNAGGLAEIPMQLHVLH